MLSSLRASVWSKNKGGPGLPRPSPGSVTELSERLEQAPVTLNKIRDCSQSRLYVLLVSAECTCTIKTPALPCTIFFYGIIFAIWSSLSGTSSRLFFSEIVSNYPIFPQVFCHKITWYTWNFQNYLYFHNSCEIWHTLPRTPMRNFLWCYYRWLITSLALEKCKKRMQCALDYSGTRFLSTEY